MPVLVVALLCALVPAAATAASAPAFHRDRTPLPASVSGTPATGHVEAASSGSGSAALHMLLGLAIVLALIFALYKLLQRASRKNDRTVKGDGWMTVVSSAPLAQSRSLHLVRVGDELVLVGAAEQSVTPIRVYSAEEARKLGVDPDTGGMLPIGPAPGERQSFGSALLDSLRKMTAR